MFDAEKAHNEWWNSLSEEEQKRMQAEVDLYCDQMESYRKACSRWVRFCSRISRKSAG